MAVIVNRNGDIYFNALVGMPGDNVQMVAYHIGRSGYRILKRLYAVLTLLTAPTLLASLAIPLLPLTIPGKERYVFVILFVNSQVVIAAALFSLRYKSGKIQMAQCRAERPLSLMVYFNAIAVFLSCGISELYVAAVESSAAPLVVGVALMGATAATFIRLARWERRCRQSPRSGTPAR